ncbi:hypothetical protein BKA69DRAFT_1091720 [Paraphysoderma sedebokerense]|nr:hypothetical protein BKA69DRAFT_1091720 [Paraphysoderma sedebokerense]
MDLALMYLMLRYGRNNPLYMLPFCYLIHTRNRNRLLMMAYLLMQEFGSDDDQEEGRSDISEEDDDDDETSEGGWYPEPDDTYERYSWRDEDDNQLRSDQENSSDNQSEDEQESDDNQSDSPYYNSNSSIRKKSTLNPPPTNYMIRSFNSSSAAASNVPDTPTPFLNLHGPNIPSLTDIPQCKSTIKRKNDDLGNDENTVMDTPTSFVKANAQHQTSKSPLSDKRKPDLSTVPATLSLAAKRRSPLSQPVRQQSSSSSNPRKRRVSSSEKQLDVIKPVKSSISGPNRKRPKLMREARRKSQYGK